VVTKTAQNDYKQIEDCLAKEFGLSYGAIMKLLRKKDVRRNGVRIAKGTPVRKGDLIVAYVPDSALPRVSAVYEDENVVVIDKPVGMNVEDVVRALSDRNAIAVHRLDTNTTGLMILAKTPAAEQELVGCFRDGRVEKVYSTVVFGVPKADHAILNDYLTKDEERGLVRILRDPVPNSRTVCTEYDLVDTDGERSLLTVRLHTGRTHQIRAHLAFYGLPVVGDGKYGDYDKNKRAGLRKQLLRCIRLSFSVGGVLSYLSGKQFSLKPLSLE